MYQAIHYDYSTRQCYLRDDNEGWNIFPYSRTFYRPDSKGEYLTLDGKRVIATKTADKEDTSVYEKDVDMNLRILLEVYKESDDIPTFHNKLFFDIESEMGGAINLEYCQNAPSRITSVALYDDNGKEYTVFVLDDSGKMKASQKGDVKVIPFITEASLLLSVLDKWQEIDPTIIITWNGDSFDIPYMYNRMRKLLGEHQANRLSPIGIVYFDEYDKIKMPFKIAGVNSLDYMRMYKKFVMKSQPSYALDSICKEELGRGKITYHGRLDDLFKQDVDKFIEYNVNDVKLIVELDAKKRFIELAMVAAHMAHVPYHYVYQSSRVVEGAIMTYLKRKNIVSPNKPTTMDPMLKAQLASLAESEDDDKFAGAYVKEPTPGLYGWYGDEDLESLYPSLGILLNLGIETFLFKIQIDNPFDDTWNLADMKDKDQDKIVSIENIKGRIKSMKLSQLINFIELNKVIIAPNGVGFASDRKSIIAEVLDHWFKKRKEYKDKMIAYGKEGKKDLYERYDTIQNAFKQVMLNAIYGALGLKSFRYSDGKDYLASAITAAGRLTIMKSADWMNQTIHDNFEQESDEINDYVIISDTDSMYIDAAPVLKYFKIDPGNDDLVIEKLKLFFRELSNQMNEYYKTFVIERFNSNINRLKIKSEIVGKKIYISAKKQYAQLIVDKEGVRITGDKQFDFKGLDFMKSSFPPLYRNFTQGIVKKILHDATKATIDDEILDFRDKFKLLTLEEVSKPTGVNKMKEYIKLRPKSAEIFSVMESGAPINTKAAVFYNDLLRFKKLDKKYPVIQIGDKMKWVYLKDNPYKIKILGFPGYDACPEIMEFIERHMDREEMFRSVLVKKLQKIYDNLSWGNINFNRNTRKFFRFDNVS